MSSPDEEGVVTLPAEGKIASFRQPDDLNSDQLPPEMTPGEMASEKPTDMGQDQAMLEEHSPVLGEIDRSVSMSPKEMAKDKDKDKDKVEPSTQLAEEADQNRVNKSKTSLPPPVKVTPPESVKVKIKPEPAIELPAKMAAQPKTEMTEASPRPVVMGNTAKGNAWLMTRNPSHYTLQLMALSKKSNVLAQLKGVRDKSRFAIFDTKRKGRSLYILLYGDLASSKEASSAQQELPPNLRNSKPWIRKFSAIQQELRSLVLE